MSSNHRVSVDDDKEDLRRGTEDWTPKKRSNTNRYLKYYFGGLVIVFIVEAILFLMTWTGFKSIWGLLTLFAIWVVIGITLLVWFSCRDDAAHDEEDNRLIPLTVSELFLFRDPMRDSSTPDFDAVAFKRHARRVSHVRICIVVMVATAVGILVGFGACQFFEKYWAYTQPATTTGSSGAAHAGWGPVNAGTDPNSMPGAKILYFSDDINPNVADGGAYISGGSAYCAVPIEYKTDPDPTINFWALSKGCCTLASTNSKASVTCDVSGRLGIVTSSDSNFDKAVSNAQSNSAVKSGTTVMYVNLESESAYEQQKKMAKVTAWCVFGILPVLWPVALVFVLLGKIIMDSFGCNTNGHDDPDRCKCCS